jgi:hypothetical protein
MSRLDHVLRTGLNAARFDALTAPTKVAGSTPRKISPVFRVKNGYWATPQIYDVNITQNGKFVAMVAFKEFDHKGSFYHQLGDDYDARDKLEEYEDKIIDLARDYARKQTGWELRTDIGDTHTDSRGLTFSSIVGDGMIKDVRISPNGVRTQWVGGKNNILDILFDATIITNRKTYHLKELAFMPIKFDGYRSSTPIIQGSEKFRELLGYARERKFIDEAFRMAFIGDVQLAIESRFPNYAIAIVEDTHAPYYVAYAKRPDHFPPSQRALYNTYEGGLLQ